MTSIADAYVELHVDGDSIEGEVRRSLKSSEGPADKDSDKIGNRLGNTMAAGFLKGFSGTIKSSSGKFKSSIEGMFSGLKGGQLKIGAIAAAIPLLTSGISALSGALVAFTGAVAQASTSAIALTGVIGSLVQAKIVAAIAFKDFAKAAGGDEEALKALSPAARSAAKAAGELTSAWGGLRKAVQQQVFQGLDGVINRITKTTLPVLRQGFVETGHIMNTMFKDLGKFVTSENFVARFGKALSGNNEIFRVLSRAAVPLLRGILNVFIALQPAGLRLAKIIRGIARNFAEWATAANTATNIDRFMKKAFRSAGLLWRVVKNLGSILRNVFGAATPEGNGLLRTFVKLTRQLRNFTELASTKSAIAEWAQKGIAVSGKLFKGMGKGFMLIKGLFDPDILGKFIKVFEGMMPTITAVVKVIQGALKPVLDAVIEGFAKNGPKFAALFAALGPLLKGVGAVIGQVISQSLTLLGDVAGAITPIISVISKVLGPVLEKLAPVIAFIILAFTSFGAKLVSMVPIVGRFLKPLIELASAITKAVAPVIGFLGKTVVSTFGLIFKVISGTMKGAGAIVGFVLRGIFNIFKGIWGTIRILTAGTFRVIGAVIGKVMSVIRTVISVGLKIIKSIFSATWNAVKSVTSTVWNAIKNVVSNTFGTIRTVIANGFTAVLDFIKGIPKKIMNLAGIFLTAGKDLGKSIISGLWEGLKNVGGFLGDLGSSIKDAINNALGLPIHIHGPGPLPDFDIPAFARGTSYAPGGLALVGERGPEMVTLPRGSRVDTAERTRRMLDTPAVSNSQENNINLNYYGPTTSSDRLREIEWTLRYAVGRPAPAAAVSS